MRESKIEKVLTCEGLALKFVSPDMVGISDRFGLFQMVRWFL